MLVRGDRAVKRGRHRPSCTRLPARQAEGADVLRVCRIAPIGHYHRLALAPSIGGRHVPAARQISDAGLAFPPHLVRVAEAPHLSRQRRVADIRDIPDLIPRGGASLNVTQEVHAARHALWQVGTQAHAHRLRLASCCWDRNMEFLDRPRRVGGIDDDYSVQLHRAARFQRIRLAAAMRAGERNRPSIRVDDDIRLVGRTPLQVDVSHTAHVLLFAALSDAAMVVVCGGPPGAEDHQHAHYQRSASCEKSRHGDSPSHVLRMVDLGAGAPIAPALRR